MFVGIYSEGENRFLPEIGGIDPLIMSFPESGTWGFHTSS
jgi:hypothetical protein